jgi:hypothetical protein
MRAAPGERPPCPSVRRFARLSFGGWGKRLAPLPVSPAFIQKPISDRVAADSYAVRAEGACAETPDARSMFFRSCIMMLRAWQRPMIPKRARAKSGRLRRPELAFEQLETRCVLSGVTGFRPIDEVGNNVANPNWGAAPADQPGGAAIQLLRISPVAYADGISTPSLPNNPSARLVSNILSNQADPNNPAADIATVDQNSLSDFGYVFGQFMDHDMDLTPGGGAPFNISVPVGDPIGGPNDMPLPFTRSQTDPNTGTSNPLQQVNVITSYLDLSQVYGSSQVVSDALRTFQHGLMLTSSGNMLPYDSPANFSQAQIKALNMANDSQAVQQSGLFAAGDVRANENIELTAMQTLFVRNHNRIAAELLQEHPTWSEGQLFQEARKINIAEYQSIVFNEWIPAVLGPNALAAYKGYDPCVNASISTEFSTVAFRFGHSLLSANIERHGNNGQDIADVNKSGSAIPLSLDFFDPTLLNPNGVFDKLTGHTSSDIDAILKGDADGNSQAMDTMAIADVRNLLFGNGMFGGQDLIARDIQRARDDGIGTYNQVRMAYGLCPVTCFAQITSNKQVQQELQQAYGSVANIDPFAGGLAEDHVKGSDVGPLFQKIMVDQFTRLRDGDSFFYLNESWNSDELNILQQGNTLAKVIEANTSITNLQSDVFLFRASISGTVSFNSGGSSAQGFPGGFGLPGVKVELQDANGDILATTFTNFFGQYQFNQLSGPSANPDNASGVSATGAYEIVLALPSYLQQTSPNPAPIQITVGDTNVTGVNFGVGFNFTGGFGGGFGGLNNPFAYFDNFNLTSALSQNQGCN